MKLIALLLLAGCAGTTDNFSPRQFVTPCGVDFRGYPDGGINPLWTQETVSDFEAQMIDAFRFTMDVRLRNPKNACTALQGWKVWLHPDGCWVDRWQRTVCGLTECSFGVSQVGAINNGREGPANTAYAHELVHAIQRCNPPHPPIDDGEDEDHADWTRDGIRFVLKQLSAE